MPDISIQLTEMLELESKSEDPNSYLVLTAAKMAGLHPQLAVRQGLSVNNIITLYNLHAERKALFTEASAIDVRVPDQLIKLRQELVPQLEILENQMQEAWKFDVTRDHHTWWFRMPHCACPKMDNAERSGSGQRIITQGCHCHG